MIPLQTCWLWFFWLIGAFISNSIKFLKAISYSNLFQALMPYTHTDSLILILHITEARVSNVGHFPGGAVVKNPPANAGDTGSSPGLGRSHIPRSN